MCPFYDAYVHIRYIEIARYTAIFDVVFLTGNQNFNAFLRRLCSALLSQLFFRQPLTQAKKRIVTEFVLPASPADCELMLEALDYVSREFAHDLHDFVSATPGGLAYYDVEWTHIGACQYVVMEAKHQVEIDAESDI